MMKIPAFKTLVLLSGFTTFLFSESKAQFLTNPASIVSIKEEKQGLRYIKNENQWESPVQYKADLHGGSVFLEKTGLTYSFYDVERVHAIHDKYLDESQDDARQSDEIVKGHAFKMKFIEANPNPVLTSSGEYPEYYNYFLGNNPSKWAGGVNAFSDVYYQDLWNGINLRMHSRGYSLEYDLIVKPGSDPSEIVFEFDGVDGLSLINGDLQIRTSVNEILDLKPIAWQPGCKESVAVEYVLNGNRLSFRLPEGYDPTCELVIDPTWRIGTYSGSTTSNFGHTATFDDAGNLYAAGIAFGAGFPVTVGAFQTTWGVGVDWAVNKFSPDGTARIYATYAGGSVADYPHSMIVNSLGELIMFGSTNSLNFPVLGSGFDLTFNGATDVAILRFNFDGTALIGGTYVGGTLGDGLDGHRGEVILDPADNIYFTTTISSIDFPVTAGSFQQTSGGGMEAIVVKMNPDLSAMIWGSYLGGAGTETGRGIKVALNGDVWVAGGTASAGFPTTVGVENPAFLGGTDAYLTRFDQSGAFLVASSFFGTAVADEAYFLQLDPSDVPYILGRGANFPVSGGVYTLAGSLFIASISPDLSATNFSTRLTSINPTAFLVDICGNIYGCGYGSTNGLPVTANAIQTTTDGNDFYLFVLTPGATSLLYSTFYGGSGGDHVDGGTSRFDRLGRVYEAVCTNAMNFPVTPAVVAPVNTAGGYDVCGFKIDFEFTGATAFATANPATVGCAPFTVNFDNNSNDGPLATYYWFFDDGGATATTYDATHTFVSPGVYNVFMVMTDSTLCVPVDTIFLTITVDSAFVDLGPDTLICPFDNIVIDAGNPGAAYVWSNLFIGQSQSVGPGTYSVIVTTQGCTVYDTITLSTTPIVWASIDLVGSQCFDGHSFDFTASGVTDAAATYQWQFPGANVTSSSSATPTGITWPVAGNYQAIVQISQYGCFDDLDTIPVVIIPMPSADWNVVGSQQCFTNNEFDLTVASNNPAGTTYAWTFQNGVPGGSASQSPQVTFSVPGTHNVTLIADNLGCADTIVQPLVVFSNPTVDAGLPQSFCAGSGGVDLFASVVNGTAPFTYLWSCSQGAVCAIDSLTDNDPHVDPPVSTMYYLTVTDQNSCIHNDSVQVLINPMPVPTFIANGGLPCLNDNLFNLTASGGNPSNATYLWTFQDGVPPVSIFPNPQVSFTTAGTHTVTLVVTLDGCVDSSSQQLNVFPSPVVDAGLDISFCFGEGGDTLVSTAFGGTTPYYYEWWCDSSNTWCGLDSVFDNDPIANPNGSAMYYVQVTDFNGCQSNIDSAFVTVNPLPIADAGSDLFICAQPAPGGLLNPGVSNSGGPYAFSWLPATGLNDPFLQNPYARPDTTTIYSLIVTDLGTGCSSLANTVDSLSTVTVVVLPESVAEAGPDLDLCLEDSVMLQGIGTDAGPAYDFEWSPQTGLSNPDISNPLASPAATTDYVLTVWSNGCPSIGDTITITVHTLPTVDAGPAVEMCLWDSVMLDAQAGGDSSSSFYSFEWTPVAGLSNSLDEDPMVSPGGTGYYYVQSISSWGCRSAFDSAMVTIKPTPIAEAGATVIVCDGDEVQLDGSYYYLTPDTANPSQVWPSWSPNQFISDNTIFDPVVNPPQTQYYYFTVQYNTCITTDSVLVTLMPSPGSSIAADTTTGCEGDTIQLTGTGGNGGATFTWFPPTGLSNPSASNPVATLQNDTVTYYLIVSQGACSDTSSITLNPLPGPQMELASSMTVGCVPFEVNFLQLGSDVLLHTWDFGDGSPITNQPNPTHTYTLPGIYHVTLLGTGLGGCKSSLSEIIVDVADTAHPDFISDPAAPALLMQPTALVQFRDQSTNDFSWQWDFSDGFMSDEENPSHLFFDEGTYYVTLTVHTDRGCRSRVTKGPYVVAPPDIFIPNVFTPNDDNNNDVYFVRYTGNQPFTLNIYDRWGSLIFSERDKYAGWDGKFNGEPVADGVYYYSVKVGDKDYTGNVTVVR